ncbi:MAG TPA: phosphonate ABC transporter, permease protein PhnE [bacterium]|jgi:phosphonate transport system permease protein
MNAPPPPAPAPGGTRVWRRPQFVNNAWLRWSILLVLFAYLVYAMAAVDLNLGRIVRGLPRARDFLLNMVPPDFTRWELLYTGVLESVQMAVFSTFIGAILAIPVAVGAASNVSPRVFYVVCRGWISISRTFPEILIAIFFVKAFGFGPFAGMLTLIVTTTGFLGKMLAEDIEDIDRGQVEAIEATGAAWGKTLVYGVFPQVMPRIVGLVIYQLDINLRESTIIGIVGAGGIGGALFNSFLRYEYDFSFAILLVIISIVVVAEWASGEIRSRVT